MPRYGAHAFVARSETREVKESSGVVASHFHADLFWTHNDSEPVGRVYAFRLSPEDRRKGVAADVGYVELLGANNKDWEDIAAGPENTIYVFDGGDNPPCNRDEKRIYRFVEPKVEPAGKRIARQVRCDQIRFEFPDADDHQRGATRNADRYDAECLMVHPTSGDLYLVTKRDNENHPVARVYGFAGRSLRWNDPGVHVFQFVADVSSKVRTMVTGGDIHRDGRRLVVRDYLAAYEFSLPPGEPFASIFKQQPRVIGLLGQPQGEAICYAADGSLIMTSESILRGPEFPVFIVPARAP
ncbi:MAG: hypothetical protein AMXMBFR13_40690 [Phycisphaerae bacterium]